MTARPPRGGSPLGLGLLAALPLLVILAGAAARSGGAAETPRSSNGGGRRVLLVTTDPGGDVAPVVVTRLRGELRAARFEMDVATISADAPRRGTVEEMAARTGVTAALGIFVGGDRVEMWAADASAGRTLMQNLPLDPGANDRRATIVAVKAVDLLKATLAEIWSAPAAPLVVDQPPAAPPTADLAVAAPAPDTDVTIAPERVQDRVDISAGAGWLQQGSQGGFAPLLAIAAALGRGRFAARLTLSAFGQSIEVSNAAGSAQLAQQIALCELVIRSRAWHGLRGALSLGAGAHHLSVDGSGQPGFTGVSFGLWSLATAAGAGVSFDVSPHWVLALDARAVEDLPATDLQINKMSAVRVGHPAVWLALAAGVRFQ